MDQLDCGRRRRWTLEEKRAIVELSLDPDCSVAEVADSFGLVPAQIYGWRREMRDPDLISSSSDGSFLPAVIEPTAPAPASIFEPELQNASLLPGTLVQMAMDVHGVPVMIAHGANPALVTSVIDALKRAG